MRFLQQLQRVNTRDDLRNIERTLMRRRKTKKFYVRKWLNKGKGTAFICIDAEHEYDIDKNGKESAWVYAGVEFKDCYRAARLEFNYDDEKQRKQALAKIGVIKEELTKLEEFIRANEAFDTRPIKKAKEIEETVTIEPEAIEEGALPITTEAVNDRPAPPPMRRVIEGSALLKPFVNDQD